jgi:hypothetical protein
MTFLLECSLRTAVIVGFGLLTVRLLPRVSAATRHSILTAAMLCAAVAPVVRIALPEWEVIVPDEMRAIRQLLPSSQIRDARTINSLGSEGQSPRTDSAQPSTKAVAHTPDGREPPRFDGYALLACGAPPPSARVDRLLDI